MTERGQATVEAALVLPFVVVLMLLVVQVGLVVRAQIQVTNAAREAARAAAVDPDPGVASRAAASSARLDVDRLAVHILRRGGEGGEVEVEVTFDAPTDVPIVGRLLPDVGLRAVATMRVEVAGSLRVNAGARDPPSNLAQPHGHRRRRRRRGPDPAARGLAGHAARPSRARSPRSA